MSGSQLRPMPCAGRDLAERFLPPPIEFHEAGPFCRIGAPPRSGTPLGSASRTRSRSVAPDGRAAKRSRKDGRAVYLAVGILVRAVTRARVQHGPCYCVSGRSSGRPRRFQAPILKSIRGISRQKMTAVNQAPSGRGPRRRAQQEAETETSKEPGSPIIILLPAA
ncbi:hypothetical protein KM043_016424 [Ampulex compressa]|nr:hypothetical protein KM043_016424 [Ampulex compressa]